MKFKLSFLLLFLVSSFFSFAQIKLGDLKIDSSITGFHFAADFQGTMVFTKNGASDTGTVNPTAFSFTIASGFNYEASVKEFETLLNMSKRSGYDITELIKKDTILNGNKAYYISYTETIEKEHYKNFVFNAFVIKDNTAIIFASGDLDGGQYREKFKKTFYGIKL